MSRIKVLLIIALSLFLITSGALAITVTKVSAGGSHTVVLRDDGTVWTCGYNSKYQLGYGPATDRSTPVQVSGLTGVAAISAGYNHTAALKSDGTVWTWGYNKYGQLGDGITTNRATPVQVSGLTGVAAVSTGYGYTVALKNDGTVWNWGDNSYGQLGDGTVITRLTPVKVTGLSGVVAISASYTHTVALKDDGTVWTWGHNFFGQLGDGTTANSSTPVQVSGLSGAVAVDAGYEHTAALKSDGTVWTWGYNYYGQLGDGTVITRLTPIQVSGLTGVVAVSAGGYYTVALKSDSTVWAWGDNDHGQLGDGTTTDRLTPVKVDFDWTPPTGTVVINSVATYTTTTSVTLGLSATDNSGTVSQMIISYDGVFDTEKWEPCSTTKSWTLPSGDGVKTVYVKFRDAAGNESNVSTDTIVLATTGAVSASTAKGSADGTFVYVDRAIVSAAYNGFFYIESDKRESGIRLEMAGHALSSGMRADISGTTGTNFNGERYILANTAVQSTPPDNTGSIKPLGIVNRMLGGGDWNYFSGEVWPETLSGQIGVMGGYGINNIGLLVRTWGRVTEYEQVQDPVKPAWCVIDDGSGTPVKCIIPRDVVFDRSWSYVTVTGISSCEKVGDELHRVLLIRSGDVIGHN